MVKKYTKASDKEKVRSELKQTGPMVVRFYKATCPACQASEAQWNTFCKSMKGYKTIAVEEDAIPEEVLIHIQAFPTYAKHDSAGNHHVMGVQKDLRSALRLKD